METLLHLIVSLPIGQKLVCAALGILLIHAVFRLLERTLPRHFREQDARYRARKFVVYAGYAVVILFVTVLFEDRLGRVSLALGVAGAGVVVALQDVIASFAGWFAIGFSNLYTVGHRIQIGETKGDDVNAEIRMHTYEALITDRALGDGDSDQNLWKPRGESVPDRVILLGLDIKMFYGGPKEAVMHGIYRQNNGFTDIVIGRKHADAPYDDGQAIWGDFDLGDRRWLIGVWGVGYRFEV